MGRSEAEAALLARMLAAADEWDSTLSSWRRDRVEQTSESRSPSAPSDEDH